MYEKIYSLHEFTLILESHINDSFSGHYFWITAEIASLQLKRGHCYLNLIDKEKGIAFPKAEFKGIIWQNNYSRINDRFSETTGFSLKQDIKILFLCTINYHPRYGLSLYITDIDGKYTLGEMFLDRQKTIELLKKNDLYDKNKQIALPVVPQRIAALSSIDSKGFEDFCNILLKNPYDYKFDVRLFPVLLQGQRAPESIAEKLEEVEARRDEFDIVVIIRGGGGNIDLLCFNSYTLAEAIAKCPLPVATGIGHTTDYTVADEISGIYKETPTALANFLIEYCFDFENKLNKIYENIIREVLQLLNYEDTYIEKAVNTIRVKPQIILGNEKLYISHKYNTLTKQAIGMLKVAFSEIESMHKFFRTELKRLFKGELDKLQTLKQYISAHDPLLLLKKGYSITRFNGQILKEISKLKHGQDIETFIADGEFTSTVKTIKHK